MLIPDRANDSAIWLAAACVIVNVAIIGLRQVSPLSGTLTLVGRVPNLLEHCDLITRARKPAFVNTQELQNRKRHAGKKSESDWTNLLDEVALIVWILRRTAATATAAPFIQEPKRIRSRQRA